jgi:hypothetical protein
MPKILPCQKKAVNTGTFLPEAVPFMGFDDQFAKEKKASCEDT